MGLLDKLGPAPDGSMANSISTHEWSAALALYALDIANREKIIAEFNLEPSDEPQLDALLATIDALNTDAKAKYHGKIEALGIFLEKGSLTKAQYKTLLGF